MSKKLTFLVIGLATLSIGVAVPASMSARGAFATSLPLIAEPASLILLGSLCIWLASATRVRTREKRRD